VTWVAAVGRALLAEKLFQAALDLSDARQGALFVVLRDPARALPVLVAPPDLLHPARQEHTGDGVSRQDLLGLLASRDISDLDGSVLEALASMDGATVLDLDGRVLAAGAILRHPVEPASTGLSPEGARTTAALAASRFGPVLKVSEDGMITFYDGVKEWDV
jgi:DNA integrity scanning protein DisA with diadenylate cyclase activity